MAGPFMLVLARVTGMFVALPLLAVEIAPIRVRGAMAVLLSLVMTLSLPAVAVAELQPLGIALEFLAGAFMGLVVRVTLASAELAGEVAGMQMGFGFAQLVDPRTRENTGVLTQLLGAVAGLLLFVTGAHHQIMRALMESLRNDRLDAWAAGGVNFELLMGRGADLFVSGMRIALPLVSVALLSQVVFALLTRVAPQLNLWGIGFLVTIGMGLVALALFAPVMFAELNVLLERGVLDLATMVGG